MAKTRADTVRAFARELSARFDTSIEAGHEHGAGWMLEWTDGPTRYAVHDAAKAADLRGAEIQTSRSLSPCAYALAALRLRERGEFGPFLASERWRAHSQVEARLWDTDHPERARDEREAALAARLLAAAVPPGERWPDERTVCRLVAERGLGWLLADEPATERQADSDTRPRMRGLERLTARYAQNDYAASLAWRDRLETLPARVAVDAAFADPDLDGPTALAVLEVLHGLHEELDELDARIAAVLKAAPDVSYSQIGTALGGIARQSAEAWVNQRTETDKSTGATVARTLRSPRSRRHAAAADT